MIILLKLTIWIHILANVGAFGALLAFQTAVPRETRTLAVVSSRIARVVNLMIGIGLLAGLIHYVLKEGYTYGPHYNGVIAVKFIILLAVGALTAVSKKSPKGDTLRWVSLILLALAALFGQSVIP